MSYGCCSELCNWFDSYLSSRPNSVRINNSYSDLFFSTSGVPQGSILGPLLFLIFVNDLAACVDSAELLMFADDIKLFMSVKSLVDCHVLQHDVLRVVQWCSANNLSLNPLKTNILTFCRRRSIVHYDYIIDGVTIKRASVVKDLGVYLDNAFKFTAHVSFIVGRATRMLGIMCRITQQFKNPASIIRLFCALVRSRLEFGSVAWNSLSRTQEMTIENLQHKLIRIVYDRYFQRRFYLTTLFCLIRFR